MRVYRQGDEMQNVMANGEKKVTQPELVRNHMESCNFPPLVLWYTRSFISMTGVALKEETAEGMTSAGSTSNWTGRKVTLAGKAE